MSVSNIELKRRYESGVQLPKGLQSRVNAQLKRICKHPDCDVSIAFTRKKDYCSRAHKDLHSHLKYLQNKAKKERYYAKHGIVHKERIRKPRNLIAKKFTKNVPLGERGLPAQETLFYENYKEPLTKVPKSEGFGYMGTIALNIEGTHIQCHICGNLYPSLAGHLGKHGIRAKEYKEKYGLAQATALIGERTREKQIIAGTESMRKRVGLSELPEHLKEYNRKVQAGEIKHKGANTWSLERRNKFGNCPEQVLERIKDLADELGKPPTQDEFGEHYRGRYISAIYFQHGSFAKAVKKAMGTTRAELRHPNAESLIESLREFHEVNGRIPQTSDFNRGLLRDRGVYNRVFGSLNAARAAAGLKCLLPMPFGPPIELTAEQWTEYKETGRVDGAFEPTATAVQRRKNRRKRRTLLQMMRQHD